jgi:hypothetical protein
LWREVAAEAVVVTGGFGAEALVDEVEDGVWVSAIGRGFEKKIDVSQLDFDTK